jgi:hypothetical protein
MKTYVLMNSNESIMNRYTAVPVIQPKWGTGGLDYLGIWFTEGKTPWYRSNPKKSPFKTEV